MKTFRRWMAVIGGVVLLLGWTGAQAHKWVADVGMHEPLCRALVKRLNHYSWTSKEKECSWGVITSYPGFKEPPWEKLDPRKHMELMFKLQKYGQDGPDSYFKRLPGLGPQQSDSTYRLWARDFIAQGGRLWVWRTRFLSFFNTPAPVTPAPPGKQTIAELTLPLSKKDAERYCPGKPPSNIVEGSVYLVTPDLSGPDPNVDAGTFSVLSNGRLLLYHGKPYFVSGYSSVWSNYPIGIATYCKFRFVKGGK